MLETAPHVIVADARERHGEIEEDRGAIFSFVEDGLLRHVDVDDVLVDGSTMKEALLVAADHGLRHGRKRFADAGGHEPIVGIDDGERPQRGGGVEFAERRVV